MVTALGLVSRLYPVGCFVYDKSLGDVLYACLAYLGIAIIFVRHSPRYVAVAAFAFCLTIELFKLTGVPATYSRFLVVRWLLGSVFSWHNIICYAGGVGFMLFLDSLVLRKRKPALPAGG